MMQRLRQSLAFRLYLAVLAALALGSTASVGALLLVPDLPGLLPGRPAVRLAEAVALNLAALPDDEARARPRVVAVADALRLDLTVLRDGVPWVSSGEPVPVPSRAALDASLHGVALSAWRRGAGLIAPIDDHRAVLIADRKPVGFPVRPLVFLVISAAIAAIVLVPISRGVTRPLRRVVDSIDAFGASPHVPVPAAHGDDEVGRLARAFDDMAERIERARRAERDLIANVSHELRTPIARVRMALALVDTTDPDVARRLETVTEELRGLQTLVEQILTAARLDAPDLPLQLAPVALVPLLEQCCSRLRTIAPRREVTVSAQGSEAVLADAALLARVFDNLLDNASKYDASGAPIDMEVSGEEAVIRIRVRDRGPGIPVDDRERVFQAFQRGAGARAASADGFGIGLALARRIVVAHGGAIRVASGSGPGTIIEVELRRA